MSAFSIRRIFIIFALILTGGAILSTSAQSQTQPQPFETSVAGLVSSWDGYYVGAHLGGIFRDNTDGFGDDITSVPRSLGHSKNRAFLSKGDDLDSFAGGLYGGYNVQQGNIVLGAEWDLTFADSTENVTVTHRFIRGTNTNRFVGEVEAELSLDYIASFRGRVGYAEDQYLLYATAGIAFTELELELNQRGNTTAILERTAIGNIDRSLDDTYFGYVIGVGGEYKWTKDISFRGEVLYYDFDDFDVTAARVGASWFISDYLEQAGWIN